MGMVKGKPQEKFLEEGVGLGICCQEGKGDEEGETSLKYALEMGTLDTASPPLLPVQIQKIIKEPVPDSGLLGLFHGQNPLFR